MERGRGVGQDVGEWVLGYLSLLSSDREALLDTRPLRTVGVSKHLSPDGRVRESGEPLPREALGPQAEVWPHLLGALHLLASSLHSAQPPILGAPSSPPTVSWWLSPAPASPSVTGCPPQDSWGLGESFLPVTRTHLPGSTPGPWAPMLQWGTAPGSLHTPHFGHPPCPQVPSQVLPGTGPSATSVCSVLPASV